MKKNIALLAGGYSGEFEISLKSAATIESRLDTNRFRVFKILISSEGWFYEISEGKKVEVDRNDFSLSLPHEKIHFDAAFIAIHGSPGEDGKLQAYFDLLQIPYTGCDSFTSALTFNKAYCNKVVSTLNVVRVAPALHLFKEDAPISKQAQNIAEALTLPVYVKPAESGSSLGISKVSEKEELETALQKAFEIDEQVLVEENITGRELTCGVLKWEGTLRALSITEVSTTRNFFDYTAKYTPGLATEITPARIDLTIGDRLQEAAKRIYKGLNCRGVVRFDFILEKESNNLYFLEVNTIPGQSAQSVVPQQIKVAGLDPAIFYNRLLDECLAPSL